jgi:DNA-binding Lrp family transcriptional regulator
MEEILKLLEEDGRLTAHQLAAMTKNKVEDVEAYIEQCERENIILGYPAIVDWDKTDEAIVTALIELQIVPQRGEGFERIAERIYQYDEVESMYLMSGSFDLTVIISGRTLREVAQFVGERLAPIEGVTGTATHFILKKYKEKHLVFRPQDPEEREFIFT